jgi:hypothetical protein
MRSMTRFGRCSRRWGLSRRVYAAKCRPVDGPAKQNRCVTIPDICFMDMLEVTAHEQELSILW